MSKRLSEILSRAVEGDPVITGVTADSRKVTAGTLFAALPGTKVDGAAFAPGAIAAGAAAVLGPVGLETFAVPTIKVEDPRRGYALASVAFWGAQPATCIAVTGTNGKTSVAGFCRQIYATLGRKAASMGTLGVTVSAPGVPDIQITPPGLTLPASGHRCSTVTRTTHISQFTGGTSPKNMISRAPVSGTGINVAR